MTLKNNLFFLSIPALKSICARINCATNGQKTDLINRIYHKLTESPEPKPKAIPPVSRAKNVPIGLDARMMHGSYKSDRAHREFFKKYLGSKFHFTVFGLKWLKNRWMDGNPPTYLEFIEMYRDNADKVHEIDDNLQYNKFTRSMKGSKEIRSAWSAKVDEAREAVEEWISNWRIKNKI